MLKEKIAKEDLLAIFERLEGRIKERKGKIASYIESFKMYRRIFLYGAGTDAKVIAELLGDIVKDREVCFIDKNKQKHDTEIVPSIFCHGIESMFGFGKNAIIIITTSMYADEIEYELMGEKYQVPDKLLGTPICAEFSLLLARNKELEEKIDQKDKIFLLFDLVDNERDRRKIYYDLKRAWRGQSFREYDPDEFLLPEEEVFSYHLKRFLSEHLTQEEGHFVLCSAFSKDKISHLEKTGRDKYDLLYAFELNRRYIPHELEGQVGAKTTVINACLGEKSFRLTKEQRGIGMNIYDWLDTCSDDFLEVKSLDEMIEAGEIQGRIKLVRLCIGNGTGPALRGMEKMIQRDKPLLILQPGGHWLMPEENRYGIVEYLHGIVSDYKVFSKSHLPEKLDGDDNLYFYV